MTPSTRIAASCVAFVFAAVVLAGDVRAGHVRSLEPGAIEARATVLAESDEPLRRAEAARWLARRADDSAAADALTAALDDAHFHVRWTALRALAAHDLLEARQIVSALLDEHPQVRTVAALIARGQALASALKPPLEAIIREDNPQRAQRALDALARLDQLTATALNEAVTRNDAHVRRKALMLLTAGRTDDVATDALSAALEAALDAALGDADPVVRALAAEALADVGAMSLERLERVLADRVPLVRAVGVRALDEAEPTAQTQRLRIMVQGMPLPREGWRFATDPEQHGEAKRWFDPELDDTDWQRIAIEQPWGEAGHAEYVGDAWYRRAFDVPRELGAVERLELHFLGVDESARVWINGRFVGEHDIGPAGWNVPFTFDVTDQIETGQRNQITVRVWNTRGAGGIWRPVRLRPR